MARTTIDEVKEILDTSLTDAQITGFISGATALVDEVLGSDTTISDDLKTEIERWLTAHMIASTREQQLQSGEAGGAKAVFQGKTGVRLESTFYGQTALMLDSTGKLAATGGKAASTYAVTSFS